MTYWNAVQRLEKETVSSSEKRERELTTVSAICPEPGTKWTENGHAGNHISSKVQHVN